MGRGSYLPPRRMVRPELSCSGPTAAPADAGSNDDIIMIKARKNLFIAVFIPFRFRLFAAFPEFRFAGFGRKSFAVIAFAFNSRRPDFGDDFGIGQICVTDHQQFPGVSVGTLLHDLATAGVIGLLQLRLKREYTVGGFAHSHHQILRTENVVDGVRDRLGTSGLTWFPQFSGGVAQSVFHKGQSGAGNDKRYAVAVKSGIDPAAAFIQQVADCSLDGSSPNRGKFRQEIGEQTIVVEDFKMTVAIV